MSTPRSLAVSESVRRHSTTTERGTFAVWTCVPYDAALPRGSALLIPGFTGSKEDFAPLLPLLAEAGWAVATYDQRGQYESRAEPSDDFSLAGLAEDACAVSAAVFGTSERVHLVGHSFGGLVAAVAAQAAPQQWASVTLLCSGPGALGGPRGERALEAADLVEREGLDAAWAAKLRDLEERSLPPAEPDVEEFLRRRFFANSVESLAAMSRVLGGGDDLTEALTALDLPVFVMRGVDDDAWPHEVQDRLASALGTEVVVVPDAAHSPAVEQPEETRDALVRLWLR